MSKGIPGSEPDGAAGDCFWVLCMYYPSARTAIELHELIARENSGGLGLPVPPMAQISPRLHGLALRGLVDHYGHGTGSTWGISSYGYSMMDVWAGPLDPDPVREPCGLGWPAHPAKGAAHA